MQVFKVFWKIALRKFPSIIMYIVIYAIVTILISSEMGAESEQSYADTAIAISVMDSDNSVLSQSLTEYMTKNNKIVELENDKEVMQDALFYRNVDYILQIPNGFQDSFLNDGDLELTNIKIPSSKTGAFTDNRVDSYLSAVKLNLASGLDINDAVKSATAQCENDTEVTINTFNTNESSGSLVHFFSYMPYAFLMIIICGLCPIIITMNSKEVSSRTACSSITKRSRNTQVSTASIIYGIGIWLLFMIFTLIKAGAEMVTADGLRFMLNSLVFLIVAIGIAVLISNFKLTSGIVTMIANIVGLGMCFLCGVFVPQWLLGESVINVSKFLPAYWYVKATNMLGSLGGEVYSDKEFATCVLIQLMFAVLIFAVNFVVVKRKKD